VLKPHDVRVVGERFCKNLGGGISRQAKTLQDATTCRRNT
jgi:hypothetical protein